MGIPGEFEKSEFKDAMGYILNKGLTMGSPAGLHIVEPDVLRLEKSISEGFRFIAYSVDVRMLDVSAREGVDSVRGIN